jgi:hypothetical protein
MLLPRHSLPHAGRWKPWGCFNRSDASTCSAGEWVVLEVGTDGMFNHVDREVGLPDLEQELQRRVAEAFWSRLGTWRPWASGAWRPREEVAAGPDVPSVGEGRS